MAVLFFDIGATLADVDIGADGSFVFRPRPRALEVLGASAGKRLGIISNPGNGEAARARAAAALHAAFGDFFTDPSLVHWGPKATRVIFDEAVASAGVPAHECVFVGEDPDERAHAREAGMRCAAHPVFTVAAVEDRPVFWVRIGVRAGRTLADLAAVADTDEVVPVHAASAHAVLAMATARGALALGRRGFETDLRGRVEETAAFLLRDDRQFASPDSGVRAGTVFTFAAQELAGLDHTINALGPAPGGVYISAAAGVPVEELHIPGATHGHTERLLPDPALLSRPGRTHVVPLVWGFTAGAPHPDTVAAVHAAVTPEVIRGHVARLSGAAVLGDREPRKVRSRHATAEDNAFVVDELAHRMHNLGLLVRRQRFSWRGHRLDNLEAEFRVEGSDAAVLVTAHLDSTAADGVFLDEEGRPRDYDPLLDPAPGADDDASGAAAVIAAAECLHAIVASGRTPARTLRFVLFNAEEQGLVGSKIYARAAAAAGDHIAAVLQMDMIAGFRGGTRKVEIHAGSAVSGPGADGSHRLGELVAHSVVAVAPDFEIQLLGGADDPAAGRSDHASFHERGWAAVAVSENFFADTAAATGTRQYHKPGDTLDDVDHDTDYASAIARSVTATALTLAGL